jgi:Trm5-related predicted tRNA methylase
VGSSSRDYSILERKSQEAVRWLNQKGTTFGTTEFSVLIVNTVVGDYRIAETKNSTKQNERLGSRTDMMMCRFT